MFSIAGVIKMFGGKLEEIIVKSGGKVVLSTQSIEQWCLKEKVPFKLVINDNKEIVIVKR
jgi:hypothetical protein